MATLYFAHQFPNARIVAIEPETSNFLLLKRNCGGLGNVTLVNAALWPVKRDLVLGDANAEKWMFSVVEADRAALDKPKVQSVTIPEILERIGESHIDLLKIDIEGAEKELFSVEPEGWLREVDILVIELHDRYREGCAQAFYSAVTKYQFSQEVKGENIFIRFRDSIPQRHTR